jgi:hypothetical protein
MEVEPTKAAYSRCNRRWFRFASRALLIAACAVAFRAIPLSAEEPRKDAVETNAVGDLTGRVVVRGKVIPPRVFGPVQPRTGRRLTDDSVIVSGDDHALANVFVWMLHASAARMDHPDTDQASKEPDPLTLSIRDGHFKPHAIHLRTSQKLIIRNEDFELCCLDFPAGEEVSQRVDIESFKTAQAVAGRRPSSAPSSISDLAHGWLTCRVLVTNHPYAAITDKEGRFTIKDIPVGERTFRVAHERTGLIKNVFINGKSADWKSGCLTFVVRQGTNDLGPIEIPSDNIWKDDER